MVLDDDPGESSIHPADSPPPWYRGRASKWSAILVALLLVFHIAGGWYFSGEIYSSALAPEASTSTLEIPVVAVGTDTVTLSTVDGFHGVEDDLVPVAISDEVADELPDLVEYYRVESAKHLQSWNVDRALYEKVLEEFLAGL